MRVVLSSAAAPDASLGDLVAAAARRGLAGVELTQGDAHGIEPALGDATLADLARAAAEAGAPISGYRVDGAAATSLLPLAKLSAAIDAPVIVTFDEAPSAEWLRGAAATFGGAGGRLIVAFAGPSESFAAARVAIASSDAVGLAWDACPAAADLRPVVGPVLDAAGDRLERVRLLGGGPEAAMLEGQGIGPLMAQLTLRRFPGALVLAPSTPRFRQAWANWLGRTSGWGCGSKGSDESLIRIG